MRNTYKPIGASACSVVCKDRGQIVRKRMFRTSDAGEVQEITDNGWRTIPGLKHSPDDEGIVHLIRRAIRSGRV